MRADVVVLRSSGAFSETKIKNEILDEFAGIYRGRIMASKSNDDYK